jgi:hypothetical protein
VEEIEQWRIELKANPKYEASIKAMIKTKDKEIQVLNQNLKIPGIDHVQTLELHEIQEEKDQLVKKMVDMGEYMEMYEKHIESLK